MYSDCIGSYNIYLRNGARTHTAIYIIPLIPQLSNFLLQNVRSLVQVCCNVLFKLQYLLILTFIIMQVKFLLQFINRPWLL